MVKRGQNLKVKLRFSEHKRRDTAGRFEIIFQFPTKLNVKFVAVAATERAKKAFQHNEHMTEWAKDDNSMEEKRRRSTGKYKENDLPKRRRTAE
ncbi:hypothetical protein F2Q69_00043815 [Brassica cretica]|uniref:Uncharacterized protein n=1 Tax=Brassica cretica TaxID=69181 RepID=A0A8S9NIL2_BRACR|nr:hypothetical protein F2Q69_00043815 [Brassica cretica]